MKIGKIEWIDKDINEAVLRIDNNMKHIFCFSHPCFYDIGDTITEPLECLDTYNIVLCDEKESSIESIDGNFKYKLRGLLLDSDNGTMDVCGFILHIDKNMIPKDITNGMYIQVNVSRIDIW